MDRFIREINPNRLNRNAPYPNIRVSFHPNYMDLEKLVYEVLKLQGAGFSIGIFGILHPKFKNEILKAKEKCRKLNIDFRTKEFLGEFNGWIYGTYLYPDAIGSNRQKRCFCRTSELIIGPDGSIYRCHRDLYKNSAPIGSLLDPDFKIEDIFRECASFGDCNPCDIKIKTNRMQIFGHTSVEIRKIKDEVLV